MVRSPRALLLIVAILAIWLAACGVEGGDDATGRVAEATTTTRPEGSTGSSDLPDDLVDSLARSYEDLGFTEEEASCLADALAGAADLSDLSDTSAILDAFNQCDIAASRMLELFGDLASGDPASTFESSIARGLEAAGLTEDEAQCVAAAFVDEYGVDADRAGDRDSLMGLFEQCDVDPDSFGG